MVGPSGRTWIAYNGEVFNFRELRGELEGRGVRFSTSSDTEVLIGLYEEFGVEFVQRLNGMFAAAIWDQRDRSLVLIRDRLGVKPLYVWESPDGVVAASEIKAILAFPGAPRQLEPESLAEFVRFRQLSGGRTMFAGVRAMEPGTVEVFRRDAHRVTRYWTLPRPEPARAPRDPRAVAEELRALLTDAVRLRLVADVPLGSFNSGGLDSSLVTSLMAREVSEPVRTFAVGFEDPAWDERPHARRLADGLNVLHEEVVADAAGFARELPSSIWHHDEPLNHANSVLIRRLSWYARQKVTVVLTGEGADEFFSGYPRYRLLKALGTLRRCGAWPEALLAPMLRPLRQRKAQMIAGVLGQPDDVLIAENAGYVLNRDLIGLCNGEPLAARLALVPRDEDLLWRLMAFESVTYLHNVLERMDKMSMAHGLEARVPFLDYRIVEFAARLPSNVRAPGLQRKALVKAAARGLVPDDIIDRPKSGFGVPLAQWMRQDSALGCYLDMLLEARTSQRGWWDNLRLQRLVKEHRDGADHSELLWGITNCELWARKLLDQSDPGGGGAVDLGPGTR